MLIEILVDGKVTLNVPATIHADGTIWSIGSPSRPVLNGALAESRGISKAKCSEQCRTGKYTPDVLACGMKLGENFGGRIARDKNAAAEQARIDADANLTTTERAKHAMLAEIARAEHAVRRCDRSQDDVDYHRLRFAAEKLRDAFYARFPEELVRERVANLRHRAAEARRIADGAMLYDCDGMLSHADQVSRRDAGYAEAADLDAQADALEGGSR